MASYVIQLSGWMRSARDGVESSHTVGARSMRSFKVTSLRRYALSVTADEVDGLARWIRLRWMRARAIATRPRRKCRDRIRARDQEVG